MITIGIRTRRSFAFKSCELRMQRTDKHVDGTCTLRYAKHILTWYFPPLRYPTPAPPMLFAYMFAARWLYRQRRQVEVCGSLWEAAQLRWVGFASRNQLSVAVCGNETSVDECMSQANWEERFQLEFVWNLGQKCRSWCLANSSHARNNAIVLRE